MVKQHNIDVHGIIMQFSIIIIQELLSPRNPRNFVVQKMFFAYYQKGEVDLKYNFQVPVRWLGCKAFTSHAGDRGSIPGRNRPKLLKQVVTDPMPSVRLQVRVARAFRDDGWAASQ